MSEEPEGLRIEQIANSGDAVVFRLTGYLDLSTVDLLRTVVGPACAESDEVMLDLAALNFCDSTGVGALVWLYRKASGRGGKLVVCAPRKHVREVLKISGVDRVIPVLGAGALPSRD
jgi:anti-anti-sigma factor